MTACQCLHGKGAMSARSDLSQCKCTPFFPNIHALASIVPRSQSTIARRPAAASLAAKLK